METMRVVDCVCVYAAALLLLLRISPSAPRILPLHCITLSPLYIKREWNLGQIKYRDVCTHALLGSLYSNVSA